MKVTSVILLLLAGGLFAQIDVLHDTPIQLLFEGWDNGTWNPGYMEHYEYTATGDLALTTNMVYFLSEWWPDWRSIVTYDDHDRRVQTLRQQGDDEGWNDFWRWTYGYDEIDQLTSLTYERYENEAWNPIRRNLRSYDATGRMLDDLLQVRVSGSWFNSSRQVWHYENDKTSQVVRQTWDFDNALWIDIEREQFDYNDAGDQAYWVFQDYEAGEWKDLERRIWEYDDAGVLLSRTTQWALTEGWLNDERLEYEFDAGGQLQSVLTRYWDYDNSYWYDDYQDLYSYDQYGRLTRFHGQNWIISSSIWVDHERYTWIYPDISSVDPVLAQGFLLEQNFPNPFNPSTTIRFSLEARAHVDLTIYNVRGEEVTRLLNRELPQGQYDILWNGMGRNEETLETGIYLCRLTSGSHSRTIKMLLLR